ncbi:MAG: sugar transferase [Candidatus Aminicenantes bacterium]|nr:MAG: sugar transferase [Candidatus Aminicenantes bacterium]
MKKVREFICMIALMLTDIASLLSSFLIAYLLRSRLLTPIIPRFKYQEPLPLSVQFNLVVIYGALIIILVFLYEKLYTKRLPFWEDTKHLLRAVTVSFILMTVLVFVSRQYIFFSRAVVVLTWVLSLAIFPLFRLSMKRILAKVGLWSKKVIILGTKDMARFVAQEIKRNHLLGYQVLGFLTEDTSKTGKKTAGIEILGGLNEVEKWSRQLGVRDVIIALPEFSQNELINIIENCEGFAETIRIVPSIGSLFTLGVVVENMGDVSTLSVTRNLVKPFNILVKTGFEFIFATIVSLLLLPVFLIVALAIKIDSRGPIIFVQERLGKRSKRFKFYKFRSMYVDADLRLERFLKDNPRARKEWEKYQKIKVNDPRVTRVGKVIRRYSLDELPQLFNFFKRNMNLVGPRPYMPREIEKIGTRDQIITRVKPGITGLWQVRGRNILPFYERLLLDEYYIRNWSLWMDIVILLKTIDVFITQEGAF